MSKESAYNDLTRQIATKGVEDMTYAWTIIFNNSKGIKESMTVTAGNREDALEIFESRVQGKVELVDVFAH